MKKAFFAGLFLTACFFQMAAQDFNFSQFNELPLLRNPALAGQFVGDLKVTAVWRSQWNSVTVPYKTQGASAELTFPAAGTTFGAGLQVINDKAGDSRLQRTLIAATLAAHKVLNEDGTSFLSFGVTGTLARQQFNESGLQWNAQFINGAYDPTAPSGQNFSSNNFPTLKNYGDLNAGFVYNYTFANDMKIYCGIAGFHLTNPQRTFQKPTALDTLQLTPGNMRKFVFNGGLSIPTSDFDRVILYTDYFTQGGAKQLQAGLLYKHDLLQDGDDYGISISGGLFTRWGDAVMPMLKLERYKFAIGVSYDVNLSKLTAASGGRGGFEVTATFRSQLNIRNSDVKKMQCPQGF